MESESLDLNIYRPERKVPMIQNKGYKILVPGEYICDAADVIPSHGTYVEDAKLYSSVSGVVERVNKLICVKPLKSRYSGDVGDVVVGRITSIAQKRWKVDINARQEAVLLLSSINLPGGLLRRRTVEDQLRMRNYFVEDDIISAEVQQFFQDGAVSLHTRHIYGKLTKGLFVTVPSTLVKRCASHFYTLEHAHVDIILGINGYIWISPEKKFQSEEIVEITPEQRLNMSRVRNSIKALSKVFKVISPETITEVYMKSLECNFHPKHMLQPSVIQQITSDTDASSNK
eukprot:TRINITY_DN5341_c0_g1_i1.p1 TRINITY_DN5341_c0_g1~~TRINITY_DN5341_c0_g1_i1.p1  ORF type:complete len:287 (-),score=59.64 TRINITY_DN5341_c0_g1_i1:17-877(-)